MFKRRILLLPMLAAAVGIPYTLWNPDLREKATGVWRRWTGANGNSGDKADLAALLKGDRPLPGDPDYAGRATARPLAPSPKLTGAPTDDLGEVLRLDVTKEWVTGRWSRVSIVSLDPDLEGMRVPLVTGTGVDDLAGSLTYYFDKKQQVQRITFNGYCGDPRKVIDLATRYYHFQAEPTLGVGLYLAKWNGKPRSVLRIRHAPVVRADAPRARLEVMLEINRPSVCYGLSPEFQEMLTQDKRSRRS